MLNNQVEGYPFQSTLPMRGETRFTAGSLWQIRISIHSPHAGRDQSLSAVSIPCAYFNPLSPCGERH